MTDNNFNERAGRAQGLREYAPEGTEPSRSLKGQKPSWAWPLSKRPLRLAASAVILLGLGLGIWRVSFYESDVDKGLSALRRAYSKKRSLEARISGFDHAPGQSTRGDQEGIDLLSRDRAQRILLDAVFDNPGPAPHQALGQFYLAGQEFDKAIEQFESALKLDSNNAQLHSDLGAALFESGRIERAKNNSGKSLVGFAKSLEYFNKALELNVNLPEPLFNRAILYEEMVLPQQAEDDWQRYLEKDSNSEWADEARQHLKIVSEIKKKRSRNKEEILKDFLSAHETRDDERAWKIVSESREPLSGKLVWDQLVGAHLLASANGESAKAKSMIQALSYMGRLEAQRADDLYTSGLAAFYASATPRQRGLLGQARALLKMGHERYAQAKPLEAIEFYNRAKRAFAEAGDEWEAAYAEHWAAYGYLEAANSERSLAAFKPLLQPFERKKYKWLLMRATFYVGGATYNNSEYSKAIDTTHLSLSMAERTGDMIGAFNSLCNLTEFYRNIGNYRQSLICAEKSLPLIAFCPLNPIQLGRYYTVIALALNSSNFSQAAVDYQREALNQFLSIGHPHMVAFAYAQLGLFYGKMRNYDEALTNARLAHEVALSNPDENIRKLMTAYASLQMAHLYRSSGDLGKALEGYNECIALFNNLGFHYYLYQAHKGRLSCYIDQGSDAQAKEELQAALGLLEKYRSTILEGDNRNNFFHVEQSVYDLAIDFEHSRMNDPRKAFEYSEVSRARSLLDLIEANAQVLSKNGSIDLAFQAVSQPLSLESIRQRLPERAQILQYSVLGDRLLIWVITKDSFSTIEQTISGESLTEKALSFLEHLSSPSREFGEEAVSEGKKLFDILIKPVEPLLDRNKEVCIIPDKALNYLPFGAIVSSSSGKYLLEEYCLEYCPSSSIFVLCSEAARAKETPRPETLLSVGNPDFDRSVFSRLSALPSASREAEAITAFYDSWRSLTGGAATKGRIMAEIEKADVVHLALHSVIDQRSPLRSKLVLAKEAAGQGLEPGSEGVLQAYEIYSMKLPRTRLVVLSACQTGIDRNYSGEGMLNIARPFIVAGVPLTVASLWLVDSDPTAELMVRFHEHRKLENISTASALRRAQIDMLNSADERLRQPYYWAPFIVIGGSASF